MYKKVFIISLIRTEETASLEVLDCAIFQKIALMQKEYMFLVFFVGRRKGYYRLLRKFLNLFKIVGALLGLMRQELACLKIKMSESVNISVFTGKTPKFSKTTTILTGVNTCSVPLRIVNLHFELSIHNAISVLQLMTAKA